MSKIKSLIEGAHRAVEMRWTVLCYDPEKDNELIETSKQFDCICAAQTHKRELAMKHPGYIIEIVAESKKAKNESIGQEIVDEVKEEIKAELKDAIGQDVDNAIGHPATEENLGAEVKDDMEAEEDELAMEEDIDDDSDSIFASDDLDEVVSESAEDDFKTKSLGAIAIVKAAGFKANDRASKSNLIVLDKGDKEVIIGLYDYGILDITAYDKGEDTYSNHWKIDKVSKSEIEAAAKRAIKSFNESVQKNEAMPPISQRKRIEFEDDIVKVYDGNKEIYAGAEDYEPMQDENWKWDNTNKYYKFDKYIKVCCESAQKNEAVNAAKVKQDVEKAVKDYFKNDKGTLEYVYVDSKKDNQGRTVIEVRAELGYNGMTKLADHLDKVVQKHDKYAYFEQETGGIMTAVFESAQKNESYTIQNVKTRKDAEEIIKDKCKPKDFHFTNIGIVYDGKKSIAQYMQNSNQLVIFESVTKANYNEIIKVLSDTIAKAAKKYPEAKLVKNYQATTGSHGVFLDEGLHFVGKNAVLRAMIVSEELQKVMRKYDFKNDIGGRLGYMIGNDKYSNIINFGFVAQGDNGASVGYSCMRNAKSFLESAQKNEAKQQNRDIDFDNIGGGFTVALTWQNKDHGFECAGYSNNTSGKKLVFTNDKIAYTDQGFDEMQKIQPKITKDLKDAADKFDKEIERVFAKYGFKKA